MIRKEYFFHIHSPCCNTPIQLSFLQSWDTCAAAVPIMLPLLCEDSYAINILQKKVWLEFHHATKMFFFSQPVWSKMVWSAHARILGNDCSAVVAGDATWHGVRMKIV